MQNTLTWNMLVLAAIAASMPVAHAADAPKISYQITKQVPLGAPDKWDFVSYDPIAKRVYASHGTEVTVVDGGAGTVVGHVSGLNMSHGVIAVPSLGRGYADSGEPKTLIVFDLKTLKPLATLPVGEDSDAIAFDPVTKRVFVMDADGAAFTAIDAQADKTLATVPLNAKPESAVGDGAGHIFANLASSKEIARIDAATLKIAARWSVPTCESPHGLAIDTVTHRLFVSCQNSKLLAVSADDGRVVATLPIGQGTDSAAFDPKRKLIFSSNADGTLSVIAERGADDYVALPSVATAPGARTMTLDPETGRLFLVTADVEQTRPSDKPGHAPHYSFKPGSVKLLIMDPR